ncbi:hypothetical protein AJ80_07023 [Polytolypa hystricis UAMH7299]|uniref:BSD domain-containing protein n=1 Tax=Polytolypa hystricis (strain UAMH7299) TaxID=1447883 RepID=A0A2B7XR13_POLH7|nr:hypothetical protein AJ80_07023 [Polytolypa hystricis UAMH7299]
MSSTSSPPSAAAAYKKRDGSLAMARDGRTVVWTPATAGGGGGGGAVMIQAANITNLQQTPATSAKVMLKIFAQSAAPASGAAAGAGTAVPGATEQFVFSFTSGPNARAEADTIKEALSTAIQAAKVAQTSSTNEGASAAMAIASAVSGGGTGSGAGSAKPLLDDDKRLKADAGLQQSLLKADPSLQRVFMESLRTKADAVTSGQFMAQFWSTRVHLLRAHAIEKAQTRGSYNVLSSIKPRVEDSVTKLNISKEQIQLIFNQHPLVKRVYDENVPKLTEQQFWSRFFQSRLFKKLRGERITDADATDSVLDKYLKVDEFAGLQFRNTSVPHMIDLSGNEENHSQRQGNRPDVDMRPSSVEKVPIIRTLNTLSEKIMANVAPVDNAPPPSAPIGLTEEAFNQLQLRDLQGDQELDRIMLNIRDQSRFFTAAKHAAGSEEEQAYARQDPAQILTTLRSDLDKTYPDAIIGNVSLSKLVEPDEDSSDDDDETSSSSATQKSKPEPVGSRASMAKAASQIFDAIRERKAQSSSSSADGETYGLSPLLFDRLTLTHATTTEFLHQFYSAYLSGNPERASEIASLVESLSRAMDRINAVAVDAEVEKQAELDKLNQHAREVMVSTRKNIKASLMKGAVVQGGKDAVVRLMAPTMRSLEKAVEEYKRALVLAQAQVQAMEGAG